MHILAQVSGGRGGRVIHEAALWSSSTCGRSRSDGIDYSSRWSFYNGARAMVTVRSRRSRSAGGAPARSSNSRRASAVAVALALRSVTHSSHTLYRPSTLVYHHHRHHHHTPTPPPERITPFSPPYHRHTVAMFGFIADILTYASVSIHSSQCRC